MRDTIILAIGFIGGGVAALVAPWLMGLWDRWMSDDYDPMQDPKNWN